MPQVSRRGEAIPSLNQLRLDSFTFVPSEAHQYEDKNSFQNGSNKEAVWLPSRGNKAMIALIKGSVTMIDGTNRARKSYSSKYLGIFMPTDSQVTDLAEIGTEARFFKMMLASQMGLGVGYAPKSIRAPSSIALCYPHV